MSEAATPAWDRWSVVPEDQKRQVSRLARRGRRHPDPEVAEAACAWAEVLLEAAPTRGDKLINGAVLLALSVTPFADLPDFEDWLERRWARRVLRAR